MSSENRRRQIGRWARPGSAACIVVDVVSAPVRVVSELPSGWEYPFQRHGLGSRLLSRVVWKSGGFRWMWAALGGRGLGIACGQGRKGMRWW